MVKNPIPVSDFLASLPLFRGLGEADLCRLAQAIQPVDAPKGTVLSRRGERCAGFYVVVFGQVKLALQTQRGNEKIVEIVGRGQTFGEFAMFLDQPWRATAETLVDSKLLHIPKAIVISELERQPAFARRLIAALCRRLSRLFTEIEGYTLKNGTQRVSAYLLDQLGEPEDPLRAEITLPVQKGVIASHLNLTHEHFSRILRDLVATGLIQVQGRTVRILDTPRLRSIVA